MTSTTTSQIVTLGNPHDDGYDLILGQDITGPSIGVVYMDDDGLGGSGLVLRIYADGEDHLPDGSAEVQSILAGYGYRLPLDELYVIDEMAEVA